MCPGGAFGSVFDAVSSSVQAALHRFAKLHLDLLEGIVREGVERGQFQISDQRPRDVAMQIAAGVQGALLMGRLTGDPYVLDAVAAEQELSGLRADKSQNVMSSTADSRGQEDPGHRDRPANRGVCESAAVSVIMDGDDKEEMYVYTK